MVEALRRRGLFERYSIEGVCGIGAGAARNAGAGE
ncbi:hypothetical protein FHS84_003213 [Rhizomicrobium electricum]|nr:hypothetical protein [Rhizomicrobium electricum]